MLQRALRYKRNYSPGMIDRNLLAPPVAHKATSLFMLDNRTAGGADLRRKTRALHSFQMVQDVSSAKRGSRLPIGDGVIGKTYPPLASGSKRRPTAGVAFLFVDAFDSVAFQL